MAALVIRPLASLTHPRGVRKGLSRKFLGICFFAGVLIVLGTPRRLSPPLSISPQPQCIRSFWVRNRGNVGVTSKRDLKRCFRRCLVMGGSDEGFGQGMRGGFGGNEARLLVVCGPSGVGKGTLMERLRGRFGDKVAVAVSHTTREPRQVIPKFIHIHTHTRTYIAVSHTTREPRQVIPKLIHIHTHTAVSVSHTTREPRQVIPKFIHIHTQTHIYIYIYNIYYIFFVYP
ncbi:hypothetical protein AAMO2058_000539600 [Amorphochlora amoebiformis]